MWGLGWGVYMQICGCSRAGDMKGACVFVCALTGSDCISVPLCSWEIAVNSDAFSLHLLDFAKVIQSIRLWINFHISTKHGSNPTLWVQISQQHPLNQRRRWEKTSHCSCVLITLSPFAVLHQILWFCPCVKQVLPEWPIPGQGIHADPPTPYPPAPVTSKRPQTRGLQVMGRWTGGHLM